VFDQGFFDRGGGVEFCTSSQSIDPALSTRPPCLCLTMDPAVGGGPLDSICERACTGTRANAAAASTTRVQISSQSMGIYSSFYRFLDQTTNFSPPSSVLLTNGAESVRVQTRTTRPINGRRRRHHHPPPPPPPRNPIHTCIRSGADSSIENRLKDPQNPSFGRPMCHGFRAGFFNAYARGLRFDRAT
jgi:hypothetical protein